MPFSLRLDTDVKSQLRREAQKTHRSESSIATIAIQQYLALREQKRHAIDEALGQADQGEFISSDAMGDWVDSWGTNTESTLPVLDVKLKK